MTLLQNVFKAFVDVLEWNRRKIHLNEKAKQMLKKNLLKKSWDSLSGLDETTRLKLLAAVRMSQKFMMRAYGKQCLEALKEHAKVVQEKREKTVLALLHHDNRLVKKSF